MQSAFRAVFSGRVQMVMYRDFAERKARSRGIVGTVQNMKDGTVVVVAEGEKETLYEYLAVLKQGPVLADVENAAVEWKEPTGAFKSFSIIY